MGLAVALSACATMPQPNPALENARAAVQAAEADPNVNKYAPFDLDRAKKDLAAAEDAALHHHDAEIAQPAYLAAQNARIAQAHGAAKADDARVAAGQTERERIVLAARTREAENAKASAANSQAVAAAALNRARPGERRCRASAARGCAGSSRARSFESDAHLARIGADIGRCDVRYGQVAAEIRRTAQNRSARAIPHRTSATARGDRWLYRQRRQRSYNEELSQRRADAVKAALVSRDVGPGADQHGGFRQSLSRSQQQRFRRTAIESPRRGRDRRRPTARRSHRVRDL